MKPLRPLDRYPALNEIQFVDIPEIIAQKKIKMYAGGGIEFHHDKKDIHEAWHKIAENNNAYNFIYERLVEVSKLGGTIIAVEQTKAGIPVWSCADPLLMSGIEQSYATHDMAVLIIKVKIDNTYALLKMAIDNQNIYKQAYSYEEQDKRIDLLGYVSKLPEEKQALWGEWDDELQCYKYHHGLGFVPFVVITNRPFLQKWPNFNIANVMSRPPLAFSQQYGTGSQKWQFNQLSDTYDSEELCKGLQYCYNILFKTMQLDKPRIIISNASQYMQNQSANRFKGQDIAWQDILYFANAPASAQTKMSTLPMTNSIEKYADLTQTIWSQIHTNAGLDYTIQSGTNKTTSENYLNFANTTITIKAMKQFITPCIIQLIKISLKLMGKDLGDSNTWSLLVKSNIPTDMSSLRQDLSIDLMNGIIDQADMYSILYGVDRDNAENKVKQVKKFNASVGFDPTQHNVSGVSSPKSGESSAHSKNAGRKTDIEKKNSKV